MGVWRGGWQLWDHDAGNPWQDGHARWWVFIRDPLAGVQPTCETAGVLGTITALIASLQVSEAIKILCGAS